MNYFQKRIFDPETLECLLPKLVHPTLEPPKILALISADEIFANADQSLLESLGEDRRLERKPAGFHREQIAEYVNMWTNTPPDGGLLVMGMNDDGTWEGCSKLERAALSRLEDPQDLCPDAPCETKRIAITRADGTQDFAVLIRVYRPRSKRVVKTHIARRSLPPKRLGIFKSTLVRSILSKSHVGSSIRYSSTRRRFGIFVMPCETCSSYLPPPMKNFFGLAIWAT
jgi:hypothetical protein